jgi:hypothetical protein
MRHRERRAHYTLRRYRCGLVRLKLVRQVDPSPSILTSGPTTSGAPEESRLETGAFRRRATASRASSPARRDMLASSDSSARAIYSARLLQHLNEYDGILLILRPV